MVANKTLLARTLTVYCRELNRDPGSNYSDRYTFKAYEFIDNGLIMVEGETTNDWFFEDADQIEPNGTAIVTSIEVDENPPVEFTPKRLLESIQGSISEFGIESVPAKHAELWRKA